MEAIYAENVTDLVMEFYDEVIQEQLENFEAFCYSKFKRIFQSGAEHSFELFPQLLFTGHNPTVEPCEKNWVMLFFSEEAEIDGVAIFFEGCTEQQIQKILIQIRTIASEAIDFGVIMNPVERFRFMKSKGTWSEH